MKAVIFLASLAVSTAFAGTENPDIEFPVLKSQMPTSTITWKVAADVLAACNKENRKRGFEEFKVPIEACSFWTGSSCLVFTKPKTTLHIIGHEMRHCFQQAWH